MMGAGYIGKRAMAGIWDNDRDDAFYRRAEWEERFALTPQRCDLSQKRIWLKRGFVGAAVWTGPGSPVWEYRWHDAQEHMMWLLRKKDF
jgi:hypothetical protein